MSYQRILHRQQLLDEALDRVEARIAQARDRGIVRPTALVVERGDPLARTIAEGAGVAGSVATDEFGILRRGLRPVILATIPWRLARALLEGRSPGLAPVPDTTYPHARYFAFVAAADGIRVFTLRPEAWQGSTVGRTAPDGDDLAGSEGAAPETRQRRRPPRRLPSRSGEGVRRRQGLGRPDGDVACPLPEQPVRGVGSTEPGGGGG